MSRRDHSNKVKKKTLKEKENETAESWKSSFLSIAKEGNPISKITIPKKATETFFKSLSFNTDKIHIIQGGNGQGKSTLLSNIANACSGNLFSEINKKSSRLIKGSNNANIGEWINSGMFMNPYKIYSNNNIKEDSLFKNKFDDTLCNTSTNIVLYTDFSINYHKEQSSHDNIDPHRILESIEQHSNGERKIPGINDIFYFVKLLSELKDEDIKQGFDIMVLMDEPESGLDNDIQKEFKERLQHYMKIMSNKLSLTVFIASHSYIWDSSDEYVEVHNISNFKKKIKQKEQHEKVFL